MSPGDRVRALRIISDGPTPSLPTSEMVSAMRHPQHRCSAVHVRADEIPLPPEGCLEARYLCATGSWYRKECGPAPEQCPCTAPPAPRGNRGHRLWLKPWSWGWAAQRRVVPGPATVRRQLRDYRAKDRGGFPSKMSFCCCPYENGSRAGGNMGLC